MATKRGLDSYFGPAPTKRPRKEATEDAGEAFKADESSPDGEASAHQTYPFPVRDCPARLKEGLAQVPASTGKEIKDQPDLDLTYFHPFIPADLAEELFRFLRDNLFFYRVKYKIQRGGIQTDINTPRFTTVFGVDSSAQFTEDGSLIDSGTLKQVVSSRWKCRPRPLPACLDYLRRLTEAFTDASYNFCLVNFYESGSDSISYHSDDERFLGPNPCIASFSLGATRDFCMKHKAPAVAGAEKPVAKSQPASLKLPLAGGDLVVMRGKTQSRWLHSIPKRKGIGSQGGRINITFRKGVQQYATENYMQYNVGSGPIFKWDVKGGKMREWPWDAL